MGPSRCTIAGGWGRGGLGQLWDRDSRKIGAPTVVGA